MSLEIQKPKFRYFIVDTMDGTVCGTNDPEVVSVARNYEEFFVLDTEKDIWLVEENDEIIISEAEPSKYMGDEEGQHDEDSGDDSYAGPAAAIGTTKGVDNGDW